MDTKAVRPEEGMGLEGLERLDGIGAAEGVGGKEGSLQTEAVGHMEGAAPVRPKAAPAPTPALKKRLREGMPTMRSAVVWSEILGKPKALRGKR